MAKRLENYDFRASLFIEDFSAKILSELNKDDKKPSDLAKELGVSRSAVSQLLNPKTNISVNKLFEISDALNLTPDFVSLINKTECYSQQVKLKEGDMTENYKEVKPLLYLHRVNTENKSVKVENNMSLAR